MRPRAALVLILIAVLAALPVCADPVPVRGGEHADFTRIVVHLPRASGWTLRRNGSDYIFQGGAEITGWDLTKVFDRIPGTRLKAIHPAAAPGALALHLGCDCHAIAFEARPGVIAIDIRAGPADPASPFEEADPTLAAVPEEAPGKGTWFAAGRGYDWLEARHTGRSAARPEIAAAARGTASAGDMRDAVLRQISRGIAEGVITPVSELILPDPALRSLSDVGDLRVSNGEMPGFRLAPEPPGRGLTDQGNACIADSALALADWYPQQPAAHAIADSRQQLFAEFDQPVAQHILEAARLHLSLGFGAEARQILQLLPDRTGSEVAVLETLSWLTDLQPPPDNSFSGMESCEGAAAFWASLARALAAPSPPAPPAFLRKEAVFQSFVTLPLPLRLHLGPVLAGYFLEAGDEAAAYRIRDALRRSATPPDAATQLLTGQLLLREGEAGAAADQARAVMVSSAPRGAEALILLVDAALMREEPLPPGLPDQLAAYRQETRGEPLAARLLHAEILASALTGDFARAFRLLPGHPDSLIPLWQLTVATAPDDLFLREALSQARAPTLPAYPPELALATAERLMRYGFASDALTWIGGGDAHRPETALLAAEASLALRDARAALTYLSELPYENPPDQVLQLREKAVQQLGLPPTIVDGFSPPLHPPVAVPAAGRDLPAALPDWAGSAELALSLAAPDATGRLARSQLLAEDTATRLGAIERLREIAGSGGALANQGGAGNGLERPAAENGLPH